MAEWQSARDAARLCCGNGFTSNRYVRPHAQKAALAARLSDRLAAQRSQRGCVSGDTFVRRETDDSKQ